MYQVCNIFKPFFFISSLIQRSITSAAIYAALEASVRKLSQETFNIGHFLHIYKIGLMDLLGKKKNHQILNSVQLLCQEIRYIHQLKKNKTKEQGHA